MVLEISKYLNKKPKIDKTVFIAEGSNVIGSVEIKKNSSVWFNCTIRADVNFISIGDYIGWLDYITMYEKPNFVSNYYYIFVSLID